MACLCYYKTRTLIFAVSRSHFFTHRRVKLRYNGWKLYTLAAWLYRFKRANSIHTFHDPLCQARCLARSQSQSLLTARLPSPSRDNTSPSNPPITNKEHALLSNHNTVLDHVMNKANWLDAGRRILASGQSRSICYTSAFLPYHFSQIVLCYLRLLLDTQFDHYIHY